MSKIRISEIFKSVQGEGNRTGVLSIWIRFAGCNLRCAGFYQRDPLDAATWEAPLLFSPKDVKSIHDVPIITKGCDSLYSIDPKFKHMWVKYDNETDVAKDITPLLYDRQWSHPVTKNEVDLCFTGGEPMMFQDDMVKIMDECDVSEWRNTKNYPRTIQIETNGTRKLEQNFIDFYAHTRFKLNWNVSPKMRSVSGEKDAVKYDTINSYFELSALGCLKFVVNETDECWKELNEHVTHLDPMIPKYIMPVGSSYEQQTNTKVLEQIAKRAIDNGYHVSGRLQSILFSNVVGS